MTQDTHSANVPKRPIVKRGAVPQTPDERSEVDSAPSIAGGIAEKKWRTYACTVPESARVSPHDPSTIVLRELDEDLLGQARSTGRGDIGRAADEAVKISLWRVNGRPVNHAEDEATLLWSRWSSKVRTLVHKAWARIHTTTDEEDEAFLASIRPE